MGGKGKEVDWKEQGSEGIDPLESMIGFCIEVDKIAYALKVSQVTRRR